MIEIDWTRFAAVAGGVLLATVLLATCVSGGVRLLETVGTRNGAARVGAYACFAIAGAVVLLGLLLIVAPELLK